MIIYQIGIIFLVIVSLIGIYSLKSRVLKSLIMALTSGVLILVCGALYHLIAQNEALRELIIIPTDFKPSMPPPDYIQYMLYLGEKVRDYSQALELTFWMLLIFALIAPFVGYFRRDTTETNLTN
ncbi:hypothetical protein CEE37_01580 [candidate division LCP-89 bacterium B3_LCP]|uniref:Uncharacterized protein n=1 Tax=candidate division LCP-89 bacterium B3_LCP TaxID=2012998 RepID=A0A532V5C8_UNCL8|nr:MAG: hypothetical protein CEE37_01580 [candidate division LCP-89 bacterium B3_LCP]